MINPNDIFGSSPKTVLNKPFMHVQDQRPKGTHGGGSVIGYNDRVLNTVVSNEISGATLSSNIVTLPAGVYFIEAYLPVIGTADTRRSFIRNSDTNDILMSGNRSGNNEYILYLSGQISLSSTTSIKIQTYHQSATSSYGLGFKSDLDPYEIYTDLKIWQLDRSLEIAPKAVNSGLQTVPSLDTTGNMMGFDISKTGANQLTITKGSCLDSTLTTPLAFTSDKTLTIPSVANTIYHIFCVKTTSEVFEARAYTSEAAVISDTEVDKFRWVGFCVTNASSELYESKQIGDVFWFYPTIPYTILSLPSGNVTTMTELDFSSFVPSSRVFGVAFGVYAPTVYTRFSLAVSSTSVAIIEIGAGTTTAQTYADLGRYGVGSYTNGTQVFFPVSGSVYYMRSQHVSFPEAANLYIRTIHLRR